jgi:regulator of sirC expression with transglutaminase-like and TPR domain
MNMTPATRWREIAACADHDIDLAEAALVIAAQEYRDLDVAGYLQRMAEIAATLKRRLRGDISTADAILALNRYLFDELGFSGNAVDYYDPRNSFLNDVLDRRLGIPITLSMVYVEIGQRVGLALRGVSFPGHFLVKCALRDGAVVIDPYARGASLGLDDLRQRLRVLRGGAAEPSDDAVRQMLVAASKKDILARVLRNLKTIYLQKQDLERALSACERIILLDPQSAEEYRDRAAIYSDLECFRAALEDYQRYLALQPKAGDADAVRGKVAELQQLAARLN